MTTSASKSNLPAYLTALAQVLPTERIKTDADSCIHYGRDWTRFIEPQASAVVIPQTIEQVQETVRLANIHEIKLVVSGGRTGLSGGAVAAQGEVVLSLDGLNRVVGLDPVDRTVTVEAGVVTAQVQQVAADAGLYYPVDFASSGSSQIGGNIATNAGGIRVIRYGLTRDWVLGLKVVLPSGELVDFNQGLIKNNTGYDLRHLMIGSEGTLGIIVEATLKLTSPPPPLQTLVLGMPRMQDLMAVLAAFQQSVTLSAFEFFSEAALQHVLQHSDLQRPFVEATPYYALIEVEVPEDRVSEQIFNQFEACMENGWVVDGAISQSESQREALWALRERISESITPKTPYKNDISVRVTQVPEFLTAIDALVAAEYPDFEIVWFGHIGDGNLHLNILKPDAMSVADFKAESDRVSEQVYGVVEQFKGSVSAEHGVGLLKKAALKYSRSPQEIELMRQIKAVFDPANVFNPGKIF
jgi:glycolate oxidase subunit GlcD